VQQPEARMGAFRKQLDKVIQDKHEDTMCKMGAIMAAGILDAGGRNVTLGLRSRSGNHRMAAVIGMAVFTQYWYWYPLAYFISLPLAPTFLIGLNANLQMPKFAVTSQCKPSAFAYPTPLSAVENKTQTKVATAVLSTTAKAKAKAKKEKEAKDAKEKEAKAKAGEAMDTEAEAGSAEAAAGSAEAASSGEKKKKEKEEEATSETLHNPARVVPAQAKFIRFQEGLGVRYTPLKPAVSGIVMLKDLCPELPIELVEVSTPAAAATSAAPTPVEEEEPPPPEPFEYVPQ